MKRKIGLISLITILALNIIIGTVYAIFNKSANFATDFSFSEADSTFSMTFDSGLINLKNPGDEYIGAITVGNNGVTPLSYKFQIKTLTNNKLAGALIVSLDGINLGTLAKISSEILEGTNEYNLYEIDTQNHIFNGGLREHEIKIEYHIGGTYYENANASFKLFCKAENIDTAKVLFVNNEYELKQASMQIQYGKVDLKTIILAKSITLSENMSLTGGVTLDLNGYNINYNNFNIAVINSGIFYLKDTFKKSVINPNDIGKVLITVNSENAAIIVDDSLINYKNSISLIEYDSEIASQALTDYIDKKIKVGVTGGNTYDIFGANKFYIDSIEISGNSIDSEKNIVLSSYNATTIETLTFNFVDKVELFNINIKIIGNNSASIKDYLVANNFADFDDENILISYDILLPTRLKEYNCYINWWSSNPDVIANDGKYFAPIAEISITLIATITINNDVFNQKFVVRAESKGVDSRFRYLLTKLGYITFYDVNNTKNLPTHSNYNNGFVYLDNELITRELSIENIEYSLSGQNAEFLSYSNYFVTLYRFTLSRIAEINIKVTFSDTYVEDGITKNEIRESAIPIVINFTTRPTDNEVYAMVQSHLNANGNLTNRYNLFPYTTFFNMPLQYGEYDAETEVKIEYSLFSEKNSIDALNIVNFDNVDRGKILVDSDYFKTNMVKITLTVSVTIDSIIAPARDMFFHSPAVIRNNDDGLADLSAYKYVKWYLDSKSFTVYKSTDENNDTAKKEFLMISQLSQLTELDFTNKLNLVDASSSLIDVNFTASIAGLKYLTGLKKLILSETNLSSQKTHFANGVKAGDALKIIGDMNNLEHLETAYCNFQLLNLSPISKLNKLVRLNIAGNNIANLSGINDYNGKLEYLDVYNTGFNFNKNEWILAYSFYKYKLDNIIESKTTQIYITGTGNARVLYSPSHTQNQRAAIEFLWRFRDLRAMHEVITLPTAMAEDAPKSKFYAYNAGTTMPKPTIEWKYNGVVINGLLKIPTGVIVGQTVELELKITVGSGSFTRIFFIIYLGEAN